MLGSMAVTGMLPYTHSELMAASGIRHCGSWADHLMYVAAHPHQAYKTLATPEEQH